jgi:hypothetical protein
MTVRTTFTLVPEVVDLASDRAPERCAVNDRFRPFALAGSGP